MTPSIYLPTPAQNYDALQDFLTGAGITKFTAPELAFREVPPIQLWPFIIPTVFVAERLRAAIRVKHPLAHISVNSGYRSPIHNSSEGGGEDSRHLYFNAIDFVPMIDASTVFPLRKVLPLLKADPLFPFLGYKIYSTFIHIDTRGLFTFNARGIAFK